ncbi:hypothetical protein F4808DRAFT_438386 [Astrocystis sublimbata]|nr:hypothetical protein F4808DRAFT_438386 [Astrocystis sublimbata]
MDGRDGGYRWVLLQMACYILILELVASYRCLALIKAAYYVAVNLIDSEFEHTLVGVLVCWCIGAVMVDDDSRLVIALRYDDAVFSSSSAYATAMPSGCIGRGSVQDAICTYLGTSICSGFCALLT